MRDNASWAIGRVLKHEGGYTNDKRDPGNWTGGKVGKGQLLGTKYGIAANSYPREDIKNLTTTRARFLYKRDYWDRVGGDGLPSGLDYAAFDYAINSGVARPGKALQRMVRANRIDGVIGNATLKLIDDLVAGPGGVELAISNLCKERLAFMRSLKTWKTFGTGWKRRVDEVEAAAMRLAKGSMARGKVEAVHADRADKARVEDRSLIRSPEGAGGTAASVGAGGWTSIEGLETAAEKASEIQYAIEPMAYYIDWLQWGCVALMMVGGGITVYIAIKKMREG